MQLNLIQKDYRKRSKMRFAVIFTRPEDWVEAPECDRRAFHIPWVYTVDDDVYVRYFCAAFGRYPRLGAAYFTDR